MDALVKTGKTKAWGVSNWTSARLQAAHNYACAHGLHPPAMNSPQHSLAVPAQPVWPGCKHITDEAAAFCEERAITRMVWAPLAEGWMCGSLGRPESAVSWNTKENLMRRQRLNQLAAARSVQPSTLALAYVTTLSNLPPPIDFLLFGQLDKSDEVHRPSDTEGVRHSTSAKLSRLRSAFAQFMLMYVPLI